MIVRFENKKVRELYELEINQCVFKFKIAEDVVSKYKKRIRQFLAAPDFETIAKINSLNLEKLKGDRKGQWSVRVNKQFRICFTKLNPSEVSIEIVELTDYH
ncbi:MAG: type II toxin-antitoxin system RelE/ParE family toxin [Flavobacteriales bacterium]|nr:type II toxin-antitoxin system RelE/ParE family toxin [Flavobacteriales bacterium]